MRMNIVLDDDLMAEAMKHSGSRSKSAVVSDALATYVQVKANRQHLPTYQDRLTAVRQRATDVPLLTSSMKVLRSDRNRLW